MSTTTTVILTLDSLNAIALVAYKAAAAKNIIHIYDHPVIDKDLLAITWCLVGENNIWYDHRMKVSINTQLFTHPYIPIIFMLMTISKWRLATERYTNSRSSYRITTVGKSLMYNSQLYTWSSYTFFLVIWWYIFAMT